MAERSFKKEVELLRAKQGDIFKGEGILAVTKALLESGVSYVGGYQGSPISHLMDVFADAKPLLDELDVYFDQSASEATAAAMLSASVMYPLRGAVTWKSTVGTNVASDALANLASSGVKGGALIIVGEDYGEGSSIMQERTHAFAMKSSMWLLDPKPNLPDIVKSVKDGFRLSEATNSPVILQLRIRSCHLYGEFEAKDNKKAEKSIKDFINNPTRDLQRIVLPPASFAHEIEKQEHRLPKAIKFIKENKLNEIIATDENSEIGIIVQGGLFNNLNRALMKLELSDIFANSKISLYVLNVAYPIIDDEVISFCEDKKAVILIEEGHPNFIEQNIALILKGKNIDTNLHGKDIFTHTGEYTTNRLIEGVKQFLNKYKKKEFSIASSPTDGFSLSPIKNLPTRPAGFCTGCPERPIFAAIKIIQQRRGEHHISADIGCHLFSILPPFNIGATTMGYGLGAASSAAFNMLGKMNHGDKRAIAIMGDGGFWHNGLSSGISNAVYNKFDGVILIIDNFYSAATGGQDIPSSRAINYNKTTNIPIEDAVKAVGVDWVRAVDDTYDVHKLVNIFNEALSTKEGGPKVIVAKSECMLNKQRREKPIKANLLKKKKRVEFEKFGVDSKICTGDHECIRLSGCPSLTLAYSDDALRDDPIATIDNSCVACGNCGEVAEEAILCPSFYKVSMVKNPKILEKITFRITSKFINYLQNRRYKKEKELL